MKLRLQLIPGDGRVVYQNVVNLDERGVGDESVIMQAMQRLRDMHDRDKEKRR